MLRSVNPATGVEIGTYPELSPAEIDAKLDKAAEAFRRWRTSDINKRTALLSRIADRFKAEKERLARMAPMEMGKTLASSVAEVEKCIAAFRAYAKDGPAMLEPEEQNLA